MLHHRVLGSIPKLHCLCISQLWPFLCSPLGIVSFRFGLFSFIRVCRKEIKSHKLSLGFCRLHWEFNSSTKVLMIHFCSQNLQVQIHTTLHLAHATTTFAEICETYQLPSSAENMYAFPVDKQTTGWPSSVSEQLSIVTTEPTTHSKHIKLYI